jgi:uncharacterized membrane protein
MQTQIRIGWAAHLPALLGLLHTVFAKNPMTRSKASVNPVLWLAFADRNKDCPCI